MSPEMFGEEFVAFFTSLVEPFMWLVILIVANVLLGLLVALKTKTFDWRKLANFLQSDVGPKIGGWIVISFIAWFIAPEYLGDPLGPQMANGLKDVTWGMILASLGGDILSKLSALGLGMLEKIPGVTKKPVA